MASRMAVFCFCFLVAFRFELDLLADNATKLSHRCPLTGFCIPNEGSCNQVIAVMIDNHPGAVPQSGLQEASLVFEALMENKFYTRLCALYCHSKVKKLGPIRSVRPYFLDISCGYNAIITHFGHSPHALARIQDEHIPSLDGTRNDITPMFMRDPIRKPPHNVYTNTNLISKFVEKRGYQAHQLPSDFSLFDFQENAKVNSGPSRKGMRIDFSGKYVRTEYTYYPEIKKYLRFIQFGKDNLKPHLNAETEEQINISNVLVLIAPIHIISEDPEGRISIELEEEGEGVCFSQGSMKPFFWKKEALWSPLKFYETDKQSQLKLTSGNTWISIISDKQRLTSW